MFINSLESKNEDIEMYNKLEYAVLFTEEHGLEGYNVGNIKEIEEGELKMIDIYYGIEIYVFKYNSKMYLVNIHNKEVKAWRAI
jgi:hypothetical protein